MVGGYQNGKYTLPEIAPLKDEGPMPLAKDFKPSLRSISDAVLMIPGF